MPINQKPPVWAWFLFLLPLFGWFFSRQLTTDESLFYTINSLSGFGSIYMWVFFNFLGNAWGLFAFSLPLLIYAPRILLSGILAGIAAGIIARPIKEILEMPRPPSVFDNSTFFILGKPLTTLSMPSGHTVTAFAIATAYFFSIQRDRQKMFLWLFVLACFTGMTRIVVGAHFPSDVFAGAAIGIFSGVLGSHLAAYIPINLLSPKSWLLRVIAIAAIGCGYILLTQKMDFEQTYPFQIIAVAFIVVTLIKFREATITNKFIL